MFGWVIYMVSQDGHRVRVVGYTTEDLAVDFFTRWKDSPKLRGNKLEMVKEYV